jgi:hypothetical protein
MSNLEEVQPVSRSKKSKARLALKIGRLAFESALVLGLVYSNAETLAPVIAKTGNQPLMKAFETNNKIFASGVGFVEWMATKPKSGVLHHIAIDDANHVVMTSVAVSEFNDYREVGTLACQLDYSPLNKRGDMRFGEGELTSYSKDGMINVYHIDNMSATDAKGTMVVAKSTDPDKVMSSVAMTEDEVQVFRKNMNLACAKAYYVAQDMSSTGADFSQELVRVPESYGLFLSNVFKMGIPDKGKVMALKETRGMKVGEKLDSSAALDEVRRKLVAGHSLNNG